MKTYLIQLRNGESIKIKSDNTYSSPSYEYDPSMRTDYVTMGEPKFKCAACDVLYIKECFLEDDTKVLHFFSTHNSAYLQLV